MKAAVAIAPAGPARADKALWGESAGARPLQAERLGPAPP